MLLYKPNQPIVLTLYKEHGEYLSCLNNINLPCNDQLHYKSDFSLDPRLRGGDKMSMNDDFFENKYVCFDVGVLNQFKNMNLFLTFKQT